MSLRLFYALLLIFGLSALPSRNGVWADIAAAPFRTRNQSPFIQIYGLPFAEDARLVAPQQLQVSLISDIANNFISAETEGERLEWDGETYRLALALRYGFGSRIELGLTVPYVGHSGGFLDGFIETWHDVFSLPQSGRPEANRDQLSYLYSHDGNIEVDIHNAAHGIGDIRLSAGLHLYRESTVSPRALALRFSLELPTGDSDELLGSGSFDVALQLTARDSATLARYHLALFGSAGILYMSPSDVLPEQQRPVVGFGSLGIHWRLLSWLAPKVQVDWQSPFYHGSQFIQLTSWSAQLVIGAALNLPWQIGLDVAVAEDLVVDTAPDIVFHIALTKQFKSF